MEKNWVKICTMSQPYQAEVVRGMLAEHNIRCVVVSRRDSVYLFGEVEVYAPKDQALLAAHLISKSSA